MGLAFIPLGVGDAFSSLYYSSSVAIEAGGRWLLVDCPHPIRKILREASASSGASLDAGSFEGVVITHVHADHASGLEGLGFYNHFMLRRRARVLAHPRVAAGLWDGSLAGGMSELAADATLQSRRMRFADYFDLVPLDEERVVTFGPFEIECRRTRHVVPTTALRIRAGGRCLGISSDTAFDPRLIAWLTEADLVLHETGPGIHTPYEALAALPDETRAKLRLIHYPDELDPASSGIEALVQGRRYEV
jgi:glyoxylase-like metal-dependent hydrolase (beta-lactamase superfamily II)